MNEKELITNFCDENGIEINEKILNKLEKYYNFLIETNEKFNLTAITERQDVFIKHFIDSILPINQIAKNSDLIDIGTGAGFPGLVLKIFREDIKLTLVDSLNKRVNFLKEAVKMLELDDVTCVHSRAEDYIKEKNIRESFDYSCSRAVAKLNTLLEYNIPYLKINGTFLAYKASYLEELKASKNALKTLGALHKNTLNFTLPILNEERNILVIQKQKSTLPLYPRGQNKPKNNPL